jgi:branched-chain amino acid transport system ATP-binding protein
VLHYADHGFVLENGRVVTSGTAEELRRSQDFMAYYFGDGGQPAATPTA